jgi:hypothetical protein
MTREITKLQEGRSAGHVGCDAGVHRRPLPPSHPWTADLPPRPICPKDPRAEGAGVPWSITSAWGSRPDPSSPAGPQGPFGPRPPLPPLVPLAPIDPTSPRGLGGGRRKLIGAVAHSDPRLQAQGVD